MSAFHSKSFFDSLIERQQAIFTTVNPYTFNEDERIEYKKSMDLQICFGTRLTGNRGKMYTYDVIVFTMIDGEMSTFMHQKIAFDTIDDLINIVCQRASVNIAGNPNEIEFTPASFTYTICPLNTGVKK